MSIFNNRKKEAERIKQITDDHQARLKTALWAGAMVISLDQPTMSSAGVPWWIMNLTLKVTPSAGQAYIARTSWKVQLTSLGLLQPGSEISVKIDAADPQLIYPNIQGAEYLVRYLA